MTFEPRFKIGDKVKLKSIEFLSNIFTKVRNDKRIPERFIKDFNENWYNPIEENYEKLKNNVYEVEKIMLHSTMDFVCIVKNQNGIYHRYSDYWLEYI